MRTADEIQKEIAALKELRPKVRHYTVFDDNNRAAIGVQIDALECDWDDDDIDQYLDDEEINEFEAGNAREAVAWRDGSGESSPSAEWAELVQPETR